MVIIDEESLKILGLDEILGIIGKDGNSWDYW